VPAKVSALRTGAQESPEIDHVICATDLEAGDPIMGRHIYFSGSEIRSSAYDVGIAEDVRLQTAVAASMAFPVVFAPVRIRPRHLLFNQPPRHGRMKLGDGGIHDNLGLPWMKWAARDQERRITCILAINSAWSPLTKRAHRLFPLRSVLVMHQSNVAARVQAAKDWFHRGLTGDGTDPMGAVVSIGDTVHDLLDPFDHHDDTGDDLDRELAENAARARRALERTRWSHGETWPLSVDGRGQTNWARLAEDAKGLSTTIFRIDPYLAARVLFHGYVMTMVNTAIYAGHTPPVKLRSLDDFRGLVRLRRPNPRRWSWLDSAFRPTPLDVLRQLTRRR
jgi:hypothetical protein